MKNTIDLRKYSSGLLTVLLTAVLVVGMLFAPVMEQVAYAASDSAGGVSAAPGGVAGSNGGITSAPGGVARSNGEVTSAPGGVVVSNDGESAEAALGSAVAVFYNSHVLRITLEGDVQLESPVLFKMGDEGDKVILDLNGFALIGADGEFSSDAGSGSDGESGTGDGAEAAKGANAIEIAAAEFDVEICGPGVVTGGKGAVYETPSLNRYGMTGGCAVEFVGDEDGIWSPSFGGKLEHGLTVTDGALLIGGDGADVSYTDVMHNVEKYTGSRSVGNAPRLTAGDGGAGIGQVDTGKNGSPSTYSYAKIVIDNGTVVGGIGGNADLSGIAPTTYAMMRSSEAKAAVDNYGYGKTSEYGFTVNSMTGITLGAGGDGIMIGAGRKYVLVDEAGTVTGGPCGTAEYGSTKYINTFGYLAADAGNGISVYAGDIGLTNTAAGWSGDGWKDKDRDSDDMGIYIAGKVTGGDSQDVTALSDYAGEAGAGILLNGDGSRYGIDEKEYPSPEYQRELGIVCVAEGGSVTGGNGGTSTVENAGSGGAGIDEYYRRDSEGPDRNAYGTDYYIINGTVTGGNGGDSMNGFCGTGGNGIWFMYNYRDYVNVVGDGSVTGGNCGTQVEREGITHSNYRPEAIYFYQDYDTNIVSVNTTDGNRESYVNKSTFKVTASMTKFDKNPTTSTVLSCKVDKPVGYKGGMFIRWYATIYESSSSGQETFRIEPSGTDYTSFKLLSNSAYRYLAYPMYSDHPELNMNDYNADVATVDRMSEDQKLKTDIFCTVLLEDGRWGKSNVMTFEKGKGWKGSEGGGEQDDPASDETVVAKAVRTISNIPPVSALTLDDKKQVENARAAHNALNERQKELFASAYPTGLDDLAAAEARISELQEDENARSAAQAVKDQIMALPAPDKVTAGDNVKIMEAIGAYDELTLTPEQMAKYMPDCYRIKLDADFAALGAIVENAELAPDDVLAAYIETVITYLPDEEDITLSDNENDVKAAEAAYNNLRDKSRVEQGSIETLEAAVDRIDTLKAEEVSAQLNALDHSAIDTSNAEENAALIRAARDAYELLSDSQKGMIDQAAQENLAEAEAVVKEALDTLAAERVKESINGLPATADLTGDDEAAVNAALAKYNSLTDEQKALIPQETKTAIEEAASEMEKLVGIDITAAKISGIANKNYTGKAIKQSVKVVLAGKTLKEGTDYSVSYADNVRIGKASVIIRGEGAYKGSVKKTFAVGPKGTSISKVKPSRKAATVKWKKMKTKMVLASGKKAAVTGYQIQYCKKKAFKKGVKTVTVKGASKASRKISKLTRKKKYYFRIRTYIKVGKTTYCSTWSKVKAAKIK